MRKAGRNIQLTVIDIIQDEADPATEGGRAPADIHRHIEHPAARRPDQFSLRLDKLIVQTAQYPLSGAGVIVLDELLRQAGFPITRLLVGLHEKTARVAESAGFEQYDAGQVGSDDVHDLASSR